jgi:Zn-dependent protease with chaperone function/uncharacterized tellurite resistance protein B-like protein
MGAHINRKKEVGLPESKEDKSMFEQPVVLDKLQYRGDLEDMDALKSQYNVGGFLEARKEDEKSQENSLRQHLLKDGVLLNKAISPRAFNLVEIVQDRLGIAGDFEVYSIRDNDINAFAHFGAAQGQCHSIVGITSTALERLEDEELQFVLGHEFGHLLYGHNELYGLLNTERDNPSITVLPYLGECLFLRWRPKAELSADRAGFVAAGDFEACARALIKSGYGLSEKNLNPDLEALLRQIDLLRQNPDSIGMTFRSHPLLPLRLQALHMVSAIKSYDEIPNVDTTIAGIFESFKKYPRTPVKEAVMHVIALGGLNIINAENDIADEEIRSIIYILQKDYTDDPERELVLDPEERQRRLLAAADFVNREGGPDAKREIISRLADIALADGKLLQAEAGQILHVGGLLGIPPANAYGAIVGAAQAVGFKVDYRMRDIIQSVRSRLAQAVREGN